MRALKAHALTETTCRRRVVHRNSRAEGAWVTETHDSHVPKARGHGCHAPNGDGGGAHVKKWGTHVVFCLRAHARSRRTFDTLRVCAAPDCIHGVTGPAFCFIHRKMHFKPSDFSAKPNPSDKRVQKVTEIR